MDESDEAAVANSAQHIIGSMRTIYGRGLGLAPSLVAEFHDMQVQREGSVGQVFGHGSIDADKWFDFEYLHQRNLVFVGSPETVAGKINTAAEEGLFNVFCGEFNVGYLAEKDLMRSIRLFGTEVIPALKDFDPTTKYLSELAN